MRSLVVDVLAVLLLSAFGREACPVLEHLGPVAASTRIGLAMLVSHAAGRILERAWVDRADPTRRGGRTYWLTFGRYVAVAAGLTLTVLPLGSGLRLLVGVLALGHLAGVDLALAKERDVMRELARSASASRDPLERPRSLARRLIGFALGSVLFVVLVVGLLVHRDFEWLASVGPSGLAEARRAATNEIIVVGATLVVLVIHLVVSCTARAAWSTSSSATA